MGSLAEVIGQDRFPFWIGGGREVFTILHLSSGVASDVGEKKHGLQVTTASTFEIYWEDFGAKARQPKTPGFTFVGLLFCSFDQPLMVVDA